MQGTKNLTEGPIRFDGNGYCDEWKEEAARRGLDCENCGATAINPCGSSGEPGIIPLIKCASRQLFLCLNVNTGRITVVLVPFMLSLRSDDKKIICKNDSA